MAKKNKAESPKKDKVEVVVEAEAVAKSPVVRVSSNGVAVFRSGMHPRNIRKEVESVVNEPTE